MTADYWRDTFLEAVRPMNPVLYRALVPDGPSIEASSPLSRHVLPLFVEQIKTGIIVGLRLEASKAWRASDAFGRFADGEDLLPGAALERLLRQMEEHLGKQIGSPTPIRLRMSLDISLTCPVHLDMIPGKSLKLPLALAILREQVALKHRDADFLGAGPVFCTGNLTQDCLTGVVDNIPEKAQGFLRECGTGHPAVLPKANAGDLNNLKSDFSTVHYIGSLAELARRLPVLSETLREGPDAMELDALVRRLDERHLSRDFAEVGFAAKWALKGNIPGYYRRRMDYFTTRCLTHKGFIIPSAEQGHTLRLNAGVTGMAVCSGISCPGCHSADDRLREEFVVSDAFCMAGDFDHANEELRDLESALCQASVAARTEYWGIRSRVAGFCGDTEDAVAHARRAIACADHGATSLSGQSRNYLIRALMDGAVGGERLDRLKEAETVLEQSRTIYAPRVSPARLKEHMAHCHRLEARLARLRGRPCEVPGDPSSSRTASGQSAPVRRVDIYLLMELLRSTHNGHEERMRVAERLASFKTPRWNGPNEFRLQDILLLASKAYAAYFMENSADLAGFLEELKQCLTMLARNGLTKWRERVFPVLETDQPDMEHLCEALRFL